MHIAKQKAHVYLFCSNIKKSFKIVLKTGKTQSAFSKTAFSQVDVPPQGKPQDTLSLENKPQVVWVCSTARLMEETFSHAIFARSMHLLREREERLCLGTTRNVIDVGQLKRRERETTKQKPVTCCASEQAWESLPSQSREGKGAYSEQETKVESPPSTQMAGSCQAMAWPAAGGTSPLSRRRIQEVQLSVHYDGQYDRNKSISKMKLRLLLLCAEKMVIDLSEDGS